MKKWTLILAAGILFVALLLLAQAAEKFRFVVMSDSHNTLGNVNAEQVARAIKSVEPEIILHSGDFTCCGGGGTPHNRFKFGEHTFLGKIPVFPTTGNHDYDGRAEIAYRAYWDAHPPAVKIKGKWADTYSFDYKRHHFIAMGWKKPDLEWIKTDLETNDGKPTFIFTHWTTSLTAWNGYKAAVSKTLGELAKTDTDIRAVFSGHSHCFWTGQIKPRTLQVLDGTVSHDNGRDRRLRRKRTFVVVDVVGERIKICPATVKTGIVHDLCTVSE